MILVSWSWYLGDGDDSRTVLCQGRGTCSGLGRRALTTLRVYPVLLHHHAVASSLGDVVDVEVAISGGQHEPGLSAQTCDGHNVGETC